MSTTTEYDKEMEHTRLGRDIETIDAILQKVIDEGRSIEETATALSVEQDLVARFARMHNETAHTRSLPRTRATHQQEEH